MQKKILATEFAPPERGEPNQIARDKLSFAKLQFSHFADLIPDPVFVLNRHRQIVFANDTALKVIKLLGGDDPYGMRPGEALLCEHALAAKCGCGTTSFCRYCGAVKAILSSLRGVEDIEECRLSQAGNTGEAFLFQVYAYPMEMESETFSIFILKDITRERRMQILERVFFHDIRNLLTALNGWVHHLKGVAASDETRELGQLLVQLSTELIDEVRAQEQLIGAESNQLTVQVEDVNSLGLLEKVREVYIGHEIAEGRKIVIDDNAETVAFRSDQSLLKRVLGNIVKNALEAIKAGETVTCGCNKLGDKVQFWVHNPGYITPHVQSQIFKWSFSTKGKDRGLGTYSMRLLSERFLGGKVAFTSTPAGGTTFTATYPLVLDSQTSI